MSKEIKAGCTRPELMKKPEEEVIQVVAEKNFKKEEQKMIKVGKPAPLFTAPAYHEGKFVNVSLDDYKGQWILLCFYPGDFTFV